MTSHFANICSPHNGNAAANPDTTRPLAESASYFGLQRMLSIWLFCDTTKWLPPLHLLKVKGARALD
jgi:hypothetical protein